MQMTQFLTIVTPPSFQGSSTLHQTMERKKPSLTSCLTLRVRRIARSDTHSLAKPFPGCLCFPSKRRKSSVKQKRELCLEASRMSSVLFALPLCTVLVRETDIHGLVQEGWPASLSIGVAYCGKQEKLVQRGLPYLLGSTNPEPSAVAPEPFSSSALKGFL